MKQKGPEWDHVVVLEKKNCDKVKCKYCELVFTGGATRIREHFLHKKSSYWCEEVHCSC